MDIVIRPGSAPAVRQGPAAGAGPRDSAGTMG